jgi:hypothetical protein
MNDKVLREIGFLLEKVFSQDENETKTSLQNLKFNQLINALLCVAQILKLPE